MTNLLLLYSLLVTSAIAVPFRRFEKEAKREPSLSIPFQQGVRTVARHIQKRQDSNPADDVSTIGNENDVRYIASIIIAGESLDLTLDTGSTDTFVYSVQPEAFEGVDSSLLPPLFDNATAQGVIDTGLIYNASYGGGNGITTTLGAIQLAAVSINGTDLSAANLTFANIWQSSSSTGSSGLLGLGFPFGGDIYLEVLEAYAGAQQPLTATQTQAYFPLVPLLQYQGKINQSIFSLVVDRLGAAEDAPSDENAFNTTFSNGTLTIGGYPAGYTRESFTFSTVPVVQLNENAQAYGLPASTGNRWSLALEYIYLNDKRLTNSTEQPDLLTDGGVYYSLIDSGNPSMTFPMDVLQQIVPTGAWAANPDNVTISCDSQFDLVFQFAGRNFSLSARDTLVPSYEAVDSLGYGGFATQECQFQGQPETPTGDEIGPGTALTYQLGDPFLRNVGVVFDYGDILDSLTTPPQIGLVSRP